MALNFTNSSFVGVLALSKLTGSVHSGYKHSNWNPSLRRLLRHNPDHSSACMIKAQWQSSIVHRLNWNVMVVITQKWPLFEMLHFISMLDYSIINVEDRTLKWFTCRYLNGLLSSCCSNMETHAPFKCDRLYDRLETALEVLPTSGNIHNFTQILCLLVNNNSPLHYILLQLWL